MMAVFFLFWMAVVFQNASWATGLVGVNYAGQIVLLLAALGTSFCDSFNKSCILCTQRILRCALWRFLK